MWLFDQIFLADSIANKSVIIANNNTHKVQYQSYIVQLVLVLVVCWRIVLDQRNGQELVANRRSFVS